MFIWILAAVLLVLFGVAGFFMGAVRMMFNLVGFFVALACAFPLAPLVKPLVPLMKVESPVWALVLPPLIAFLVVELIFVGVAFGVHYLIIKKMKLSTDELGQGKFERLNQRTGVGFGAVTAFAHLIVIGVLIHVGGYPAAQFSQGGDAPGAVGFLGSARADLKETGLDKITAKFNPVSNRYYEISDLLGLVYNNPILTGRLGSYPGYLALGEKQEFKDIGSDTEYLQMIQTKGDLTTLFEHPKTQAIINNPETMKAVTDVDLRDLRTYLESGKSPKYDEEPLLGRWRVDANAVLRQTKRSRPDVSAQELSVIKHIANTILAGIVLTATPDNQIFIKAPPLPAAPKPAEGAETVDAAAAQAQQAVQDRYGVRPPARPTAVAPTALAPAIRQRFGGGQAGARPGAAPRVEQSPVQVARATPPPPKMKPEDVRVAGSGTWKVESGVYEVALQTDAGANVKLKARLENERLLLASGPLTLVFEKVH